jgi:hypothetical protein
MLLSSVSQTEATVEGPKFALNFNHTVNNTVAMNTGSSNPEFYAWSNALWSIRTSYYIVFVISFSYC